MKANLLSLGYCGVEGIQFPVEVTLVKEQWYGLEGYAISTEEVIRIGGDPDMFLEGGTYTLVEEEFELLEGEHNG